MDIPVEVLMKWYSWLDGFSEADAPDVCETRKQILKYALPELD